MRALGLLLTALVLAGIATPASALIELKAGYSVINTSPSTLNDYIAPAPKVEALQSLSADVMASLPLLPVGLGVRYETIGSSSSTSGIESKVEWQRMSILANKRFVDTGIYIGPIATVSVANEFKYKRTTGGVTTEYKAGDNMTASLGLEAGLKLLLLRIGAEVGYLYAPLGELKDSAGVVAADSSGTAVKPDLSGAYYRAVIGFGF